MGSLSIFLRMEKHQPTNNTTERKYAPKPKLSTRVGQYKKENFYLIYNWVTTR
jgi:hypothetical protein